MDCNASDIWSAKEASKRSRSVHEDEPAGRSRAAVLPAQVLLPAARAEGEVFAGLYRLAVVQGKASAPPLQLHNVSVVKLHGVNDAVISANYQAENQRAHCCSSTTSLL